MNPCCDVCGRDIIGTVNRALVDGKNYSLCEWDGRRVRDMIEGVRGNVIMNIFWGAGHVNWTCWNTIRDIIRKNGITEVLELGIGLSTELFVNEGLKVVGFDACAEHVELYQKLLSLKNDAELHYYPEKAEPPPVELLYPGRTWDFVFVDGPQERSREVGVAMRVSSRFIYLHDPNMGEQGFFPNDDWQGIGTEPRLFVRKELVHA